MVYSDQKLACRLERTEARANAACVDARARLFPGSRAQWLEVAGAYAMFDGPESPLTQTFGLGLFEEVTPHHLDKLEAFFKEQNAPVFHEVSPMADSSLLSLLNERKYQPLELTSVLYRELTQDFEIQVSRTPRLKARLIKAEETTLWAHTLTRGWSTEVPGLSDFMLEFGQITASSAGAFPFIAELAGEPIAAGGLFIYDGVALLAGASTAPEGRRQGAQMALLNARLQYAAEQGCTIAMMGASPGSQSQRNAEKNGFRIAYTRIKWQLRSGS
ncbi:GNAT family N-acetyltransferase [Hymenobacter sp. GOD-10R]|uniref:GNAT family N-acetyltransferase n=1 Tax=Hymenobacter sp. GOD-10R TaxID=3093922 RepID=UPI002D7839D8|nr:GNAT family N-acetyltransferase [Hymenobacter sp. GOD-10R]WRQ27561.1 GNAT family N-acetyltransferase [Hymenobacter sp. GOD-10R]